jgi:hypothetical protein
MRKYFWPLCLAMGLAGSQPVMADVWDLDSLNDEDDSTATDNEMVHGLVQVHDLAAEGGVVDQDWYRVASRPYASYEVLVDGVTGDVFFSALPVDHIAADGTTVVNTSQEIPGGAGAARTVRWQVGAVGATEFVRVTGDNTACTVACTTSEQYTIKFFETTAFIPRFNNSGSQITVLLLQNASSYTISGNIYYFNAAGAPVGSQPFTATTRQLLVVPTSSTVPGASGSIVITHDARYGDLQGKSVALEPSTGFSFDTPLVYKPK